MRIASIDIGSNTVILLIAEYDQSRKELIPLKQQFEIPRISKGLTAGGNISAEKINLLSSVLESYSNEIEEYSCSAVMPVATNALRIAANGNEIVNAMAEKTGLKIRIISGDEEAYFSFTGATSRFSDQLMNCVIDIGGGSTEIILGNEDGIKFRKSFPIGSVLITEKFFTSLPPSEIEKSEAELHINKVISEIAEFSKIEKRVISVAGTATTLTCINSDCKEYDEKAVEGSILTNEDLSRIIDSLGRLTPSEVSEEYGNIVRGREDVLLAGTLILKNIVNAMGTGFTYISGRGLRYGVLLDYIRTQNLT